MTKAADQTVPPKKKPDGKRFFEDLGTTAGIRVKVDGKWYTIMEYAQLLKEQSRGTTNQRP